MGVLYAKVNNVWTPILGGTGGGGVDIPTGDARWVNITGDQMTGPLRIDTTVPFNLTDPGTLMVGGAAAAPVNTNMDGYRIQTRNAGAIWPLSLQPFGHRVRVNEEITTGTGGVDLFGVPPTGGQLRWINNGQVGAQAFLFGNAPAPYDWVLQTLTGQGNNIALQAAREVWLVGGGSTPNNVEVASNQTRIFGGAECLRLHGSIAGTAAQSCWIGFQDISLTRQGFVGAQGGWFRCQADTGPGLPVLLLSGGAHARISAAQQIEFVAGGTESGRFQESGNWFLVGKTANDQNVLGYQCAPTNSAHTNQATGTPCFATNKIGAGDANNTIHMQFRRSGTNTGSISSPTATSTAFNTTSDYRLKHDRGIIERALDRLNLLTPRRIVWKDDPDEREMDGFFAHEVAEVVPEAVTGDKDAVATETVAENGVYEGQIIPQQMDTSMLVPLLVAAVKELSAQVAELRGAA